LCCKDRALHQTVVAMEHIYRQRVLVVLTSASSHSSSDVAPIAPDTGAGKSAMKIYTDDTLDEIWRMPLSHGHSWSALAVCTTPPPPPAASKASSAAAELLRGEGGSGGLEAEGGAEGDLIVTASFVDLRDEGTASAGVLGGKGEGEGGGGLARIGGRRRRKLHLRMLMEGGVCLP
jgi:hypothetical protein